MTQLTTLTHNHRCTALIYSQHQLSDLCEVMYKAAVTAAAAATILHYYVIICYQMCYNHHFLAVFLWHSLNTTLTCVNTYTKAHLHYMCIYIYAMLCYAAAVVCCCCAISISAHQQEHYPTTRGETTKQPNTQLYNNICIAVCTVQRLNNPFECYYMCAYCLDTAVQKMLFLRGICEIKYVYKVLQTTSVCLLAAAAADNKPATNHTYADKL
jgi:hypothetical protein